MAGAGVAGSAALTLVTGCTPVRPEPALFEAMLDGWRSQQRARRLGESIIGSRERTVRRFVEFTGGWPWSWTAGQLSPGSPPAVGAFHGTQLSRRGRGVPGVCVRQQVWLGRRVRAAGGCPAGADLS